MSAPQGHVGEFALADADFDVIARMTYAHSGIVLNDGKKQLVYSRLAKQIRRRQLHRCGGRTIGQDEATSVVYGMPQSAFTMGAVGRQLPLQRIAAAAMGAGA